MPDARLKRPDRKRRHRKRRWHRSNPISPFSRQHTTTIVLTGPRGAAKVVVAPQYQGRVMTSTTGGSDAPSFGWIGTGGDRVGQRQPHMNVFGGEDRFWLGPEGGQFALYFKQGDPFDLDHWQVPERVRLGTVGRSRASRRRR